MDRASGGVDAPTCINGRSLVVTRPRWEARARALEAKTQVLAEEALAADATPVVKAAIIAVLIDIQDHLCEELSALLSDAYGAQVIVTGSVTPITSYAVQEMAA
jgi:hypothetical protein